MRIIILGAGETGYHLARRLAYEKQEVIIVDRDQDRISLVEETLDVQTLVGGGSSPTVLRQSGIETASMFVAVTDSDEVNLVACFVGGKLNRSMKKVARLRHEDYCDLPEILDEHHLGVDLVISPEVEAVKKLMNVLEIPGAIDVIDFAEGRVKLVGIRLPADSPLVGKPLVRLREEYPDRKLFIPAILRESEVLIPKGNDVLHANDAIYLMAPVEFVQMAIEIAGGAAKKPKKFFLVGGTTVGLKIAQELERRGFSQITLIEADPVKCQEMAAVLDHTLVLNSETLDEPFLRGEGVGEADVFMAVTDDDEHNALVALLAKRVGAARVAALTNKVDYHRLLSAVGIDIVINPRLTAASRILQYIRKGKVISVSMLPGEEVEAMEFEAMETSRLVGKPLRKLKFPKGAILGGVERAGYFFIPDGDTRIEPGDRTVFFANRDAVANIEKLVTVGLSYF